MQNYIFSSTGFGKLKKIELTLSSELMYKLPWEIIYIIFFPISVIVGQAKSYLCVIAEAPKKL